MLHYVHQLITNFPSLSFGAGQVVYSPLITGFCWKQMSAAAAGNKVDESSETEPKEVSGCKT